MSRIADQQIAAIRAYKAAHPDVDWTANIVRLKHTADGFQAIGHELKDPRVEAMLDRCCAPGCRVHEGETP